MAQGLADQGAGETGVARRQPGKLIKARIEWAALLQDAGKNGERRAARR
jgi:hypothetical protein